MKKYLNKFKTEYKKSGTGAILFFCKKIIAHILIKINNFFFILLSCQKTNFASNDIIRDVEVRALKRSDISDHLMTIFTQGLEAKPKSIVELGTRGGESTFVLEKIASILNSKMLCIDLEDCSSVLGKNTIFVKSDDIEFGKNFKQWAEKTNFPSQIDLLFIDTSHEYEHTKAEINTYFPLLSDGATVIFHDTNVITLFERLDGTMDYGQEDNARGVIKPIEEYLNLKLNEKKDFTEYKDNWLIKHWAISNGLTVMKKI